MNRAAGRPNGPARRGAAALNRAPHRLVLDGMNLRALPALLALPLAALANDGADFSRGRGPRVILYEHPNFQGGAIVLRVGEAVENFARWDFDNGRRANDRVSSIRVEGGAEAIVFTDAHFRGEALHVTDDIRDLRRGDRRGPRFDDAISSARVSLERDPHPGPGRPSPARPHTPPGRDLDFEKVIHRAFQDVLERDPTDGDLRHYRSLMIERGWNEQQVRANLRTTEEYRVPVMTRRLNRIYRELLARDVDPRGFDHYRNKIIEHGWSDDDIRRDIRNSAEYRTKTSPPAPAPREEHPRRNEAGEMR